MTRLISILSGHKVLGTKLQICCRQFVQLKRIGTKFSTGFDQIQDKNRLITSGCFGQKFLAIWNGVPTEPDALKIKSEKLMKGNYILQL